MDQENREEEKRTEEPKVEKDQKIVPEEVEDTSSSESEDASTGHSESFEYEDGDEDHL